MAWSLVVSFLLFCASQVGDVCEDWVLGLLNCGISYDSRFLIVGGVALLVHTRAECMGLWGLGGACFPVVVCACLVVVMDALFFTFNCTNCII